MSTTRIAFVCVFIACLLCCNNKKSKNVHAVIDTSAMQPVTAGLLTEANLNLRAYSEGFISNVAQRFTVPAKRTTVITTAKGLKVTIQPSALELEDGSPVEGKIEVSIVELTNRDDLFKSNAATVSNGRLIASGGSYFIGMESNGQKIRIKNGNTLQVEFPVIARNEMELFYGERDSVGNMNWQKAGKGLEQEYETISFNTTAENEPEIEKPVLKSKYHLFNSLDAKVKFLEKPMTLADMLQEFKKRKINKIIDTVYYSWNGGKNVVYSYTEKTEGYRYGRQYRLISPDELCREKDSLEKALVAYNQAVEERMQDKFTMQLKKYYAPAVIGKLGWINCDRFYQYNDKTETELDIPITLHNSPVQYFIIFKSFNGLISNTIIFNKETKFVLNNLPVGERVTLVAFAKNNGIIYHGKEEFSIGKNKKQPVEFKPITKEELSKIFGNNVKA